MKTSDLKFEYPEELIATFPQRPSRVMWVKGENRESLEWKDFLKKFRKGDLIVVNDTRVTPVRVWASAPKGKHLGDCDILFVRAISPTEWEVLAPFKKMKGVKWTLPEGIEVLDMVNGLPQTVRLSREIGLDYFTKHGEVPLPPYILKSRADRHSHSNDKTWYQSIFAEKPGSSAAPTASLHFTKNDFEQLKTQGVDFATLTLHVGLGTYLPVSVEDLDQHKMHAEEVSIPMETWSKVRHSSEGRIFALGTTVARALESAVLGKLQKTDAGFFGKTDLLIQPGYDFKMIRALMTNFHQPESTLLALVVAFAGLENVRASYQWAINERFRLFSYGDLTVWEHL